jgi:hypothetical protein
MSKSQIIKHCVSYRDFSLRDRSTPFHSESRKKDEKYEWDEPEMHFGDKLEVRQRLRSENVKRNLKCGSAPAL